MAAVPTTSSFWQHLPRPIIGLSPMDGITDHPFRHITKKYGQPAVMYTEFTSTEGVCHGAIQLLKDFRYDESQRPIIGQIYGTTPDYFRQCAIILGQLGFDGIDINMGCPAKNVAHSGAGAALIQTPKLAQELIRQTKLGVQQWQNGATVDDCPDVSAEIAALVRQRAAQLPTTAQSPNRPLPVSVKTRVGYHQPVIHDWIPTLLELEPAAIALHGRTLKQQYGGQASWELIGQAAELTRQTQTLLLGNGDLKSLADAEAKIADYGSDGALLGRAAMGNPFVFQKAAAPSLTQLLDVAWEHAQLYEQSFSQDPKYNFLPMRKHLGWYIHDIPNASAIRQAIYRANSSQEFAQILQEFGLRG